MSNVRRTFTGQELLADGPEAGSRESNIQVWAMFIMGFSLMASIGFAYVWNPLGLDFRGQGAVWMGALLLSGAVIAAMFILTSPHERARLAARHRFFIDRGVDVAPVEMRTIFDSEAPRPRYREGLIFTFQGVRDGRVALFSVHGEDGQLVMKDDQGTVVKPR